LRISPRQVFPHSIPIQVVMPCVFDLFRICSSKDIQAMQQRDILPIYVLDNFDNGFALLRHIPFHKLNTGAAVVATLVAVLWIEYLVKVSKYLFPATVAAVLAVLNHPFKHFSLSLLCGEVAV